MIKELLFGQAIIGAIAGGLTVLVWAIYRKVTKKPICLSCKHLEQYNPQRCNPIKCKPPGTMLCDYYMTAPKYCANYCPLSPSETPETKGGIRYG